MPIKKYKTEEEIKEAKRLAQKKYYYNNLDKVKISKQKWYDKNPEYNKKYYLENCEEIREQTKEYKNENKEIVKNKNKNYYVNNKQIISEKQKEKYITRDKTKFNKVRVKYYHKIKHKMAWRAILKRTIKQLNQIKTDKTINLLGYSALELKEHICSLFTEGMSWDNYGEWHIDHIKGVCQFDDKTPPSIVNELPNLRPLWATTREINGIIYEGNLNRPK